MLLVLLVVVLVAVVVEGGNRKIKICNINSFDNERRQNKLKEYQRNIENLTYQEYRRKEKHESTRIIFNSEATPENMYQNVMNNTTFIFRNRVFSEGRKIISRLKGIRGKKNAGAALIWLGVLITAISAYILFFCNSEDFTFSIKRILAAVMVSGAPVFLIIGLFVRCSGRRYMMDYLNAWNPFSTPTEINRLVNGQIVIIGYATNDRGCGSYTSALKSDDTIWDERPTGQSAGFVETFYNTTLIPTYVNYMYIIDSIKSCTKTKSGIMIESSGRYYGIRSVNGSDRRVYWVFTEVYISYKKEEILDIFTNMELLESSLMNYGYYEEKRDRFYPL